MAWDKIRSQTNWKELFQENKVVNPIYVALSGSHLYGFHSLDSDIDLRGCHSEHLYDAIGLHGVQEVREKTAGEIDFVSFDVRKELQLILANNSNVLEHLASVPVYKSDYYEELRSIAEKSLSKLVAKPYWGMAQSNLHKYLRTFNEAYRENPAKKYLYVIRGYMAGIYALENKRIEPNLKTLNGMRRFSIPVVDQLIGLKMSGEKAVVEKTVCLEADKAIDWLQKEFQHSEENSTLPPRPQTYELINDFLIRVRMKS